MMVPGLQADAETVVVLGDSLSAEYAYQEVNFNTDWEAKNWVEILGERRDNDFDFGQYRSSIWDEVRGRGYEFNWSVSGITAVEISEALMTSGGVPTELETQVRDHADIVVVMAGANDFVGGGFGDVYEEIYEGGESGPVVDAVVSSLEAIVASILDLNPEVTILLANVIDPGITPVVRDFFPGANGRARVSNAVVEGNDGIAVLAGAKENVFLLDVHGETKRIANETPLVVAGTEIEKGDHPENAPEYLYTWDGFHPNTIGQAMIAALVVDTVNQAQGGGIDPIQNHEKLVVAGLAEDDEHDDSGDPVTPEDEIAAFFGLAESGEVEKGRVVASSWLGDFAFSGGFDVEIGEGWLFHEQHGWLYWSGTGWFWRHSQQRWTYMTAEMYPFVYAHEVGWFYFHEDSPRWPEYQWFYDYNAFGGARWGRWFHASEDHAFALPERSLDEGVELLLTFEGGDRIAVVFREDEGVEIPEISESGNYEYSVAGADIAELILFLDMDGSNGAAFRDEVTLEFSSANEGTFIYSRDSGADQSDIRIPIQGDAGSFELRGKPSAREQTDGMLLVEGGTLSAESQLGAVGVATFEIGRYPVTWGEWKEVRNWAESNGYDIGSAGDGCADEHPVHSVSWFDVVKWCNARSEMDGLEPVYRLGDGSVYRSGQAEPAWIDTATGYRLPGEAEWEFAARGGNESEGYTYSGSNDLDEVGWYWENSQNADCSFLNGRGTYPVGEKAPNELGIYDMSGNVREWCWDAFGMARYLRGGSWYDNASGAGVAFRLHFIFPNDVADFYGFRVAKNH